MGGGDRRRPPTARAAPGAGRGALFVLPSLGVGLAAPRLPAAAVLALAAVVVLLEALGWTAVAGVLAGSPPWRSVRAGSRSLPRPGWLAGAAVFPGELAWTVLTAFVPVVVLADRRRVFATSVLLAARRRGVDLLALARGEC